MEKNYEFRSKKYLTYENLLYHVPFFIPVTAIFMQPYSNHPENYG